MELKGQDWTQPELAWIFTIAIVFLGLSAAVAGWWLEKAGPRKSGFVAACCWSLGFVVSAVGVWLHQLWMLYAGYGVLGGCGLGLGYITPVSTLIHWFPDRRGMATGMAIMGFGGGAMIAVAPVQPAHGPFRQAAHYHGRRRRPSLVLGGLYFVAMTAGAFLFRVPPPGWTPPGWTPPAQTAALITTNYVHPNAALATPAFYLLWAVLFLNVTAGIGILEQAAPMIQEVFNGRVSGRRPPASSACSACSTSSADSAGRRPPTGSGENRLTPSSLSLGAALFVALPFTWRAGSVPLFVACTGVILTMYGGGFATIPAYLSDIFGIALRRRHPRPAADGLVGGGRRRACAGELHPPVPDRPRRRQGRRLRLHHVPHGRPARRRACVQPARRPRPPEALCVHCRDTGRSGARQGLTGQEISRRNDHGLRPATPARGRGPPTSWLLVVAWTAVSLPLAWGVWMTVAGGLEAVHRVGPPRGRHGRADCGPPDRGRRRPCRRVRSRPR